MNEKSSYAQTEEEFLKFWDKNKVFEKSIKQRKGKKSFVFFEGPPSANGRPGFHHAISRAFKDLICRYRSMRGFLVERKGGWDTHGLPVEIQVEKELGFRHKQDIEKYGIEKFNKKAKELVWKYKDEWERFTKRIGFWLDIDNPYITYENNYIESVWWILQQIWQKKLIYKGYKVSPYCSRCETVLSSHEVAQGYSDVTDESVYVKFKIINKSVESSANKNTTDRYLLAWTTTPWTLPGNVALAVGPDIKYVEIKIGNDHYILAEQRLSVIKEEYSVIKSYKGKDLVGLGYKPPFESLADLDIENIDNAFKVYPAGFVSTEDGTGIVHTAVMYGIDDFDLGEKFKLPKFHTVNEQGKFKDEVKEFNGRYVKEAECDLINYLDNKSLLYQKEKIQHSYPFCWRCKTPLLYYAKTSWFIKISSLRKELARNNENINWVPAHLKKGRFGEWLKETKDWALSRERYWGTPLPVWECEKCDNHEMIGSLKELNTKRYFKNNFFLLRHGEADHNVAGKVGPRDEVAGKESRLTAKGQKQIARSVKLLKKYKIDVILSSDVYRIRQTAEIVEKEVGKPIKFYSELREIDNGGYQQVTLKEYHSHFNNKLELFSKRLDRDAENLTDLKKRMGTFIRRINKEYENKNILVIGHGDPLWVLEGLSKNLSNEQLLKSRYIKNGEIRKIKIDNFPYNHEGDVDIHRPYVDKIFLKCGQCGSSMNRVKEVIDVWFDSGAMPLAQWHYPFENKKKFKDNYPADYIAEGIDQTRGWFYTLLAISTLLGKGNSYKNVISVGHVLDEKGEKMSKSKGNIVDPWEMINKYSNDALRWYLFTVNSPGEPTRFKEKDVAERLNKFIATLKNTNKFFTLYVDNKHQKKITAARIKKLSVLDRWVLSELNILIAEVGNFLDNYEIFKAARAIDKFVDDLSNWYIRRSRRRFQRPSNKQEKELASLVLRTVLIDLSKLIAPFAPFLAEDIYQSVKNTKSSISVHLCDYPKGDKKLINKKLTENMNLVRGVVTLGLKLRAKTGIKVRQPLSELRIKNYGLKITDQKSKEGFNELVQEELNVQKITSFKDFERLNNHWSTEEEAGLKVALNTEITPELQKQGLAREIIRQIQDMRKEAKYSVTDKILVRWSSEVIEVENTLKDLADLIKTEILAGDIKEIVDDKKRKFDIQSQVKVGGKDLWIGIVKI